MGTRWSKTLLVIFALIFILNVGLGDLQRSARRGVAGASTRHCGVSRCFPAGLVPWHRVAMNLAKSRLRRCRTERRARTRHGPPLHASDDPDVGDAVTSAGSSAGWRATSGGRWWPGSIWVGAWSTPPSGWSCPGCGVGSHRPWGQGAGPPPSPGRRGPDTGAGRETKGARPPQGRRLQP